MIEEGLPERVLLDTCAVIWLANGETMSPHVVELIEQAAKRGGVFVSTVSAWEIGMLSRPRPSRPQVLAFHPDPKTWFARFVGMPGVNEVPITADIAIDASYLPDGFHADPMDRLVVATARHLGLPVVTSERPEDHCIRAGGSPFGCRLLIRPCRTGQTCPRTAQGLEARTFPSFFRTDQPHEAAGEPDSRRPGDRA